MNVGSLFSGVGGLDLGLQRAGMREPSSLSGDGEVLAGEASSEQINVLGAVPSRGESVFVASASSHRSLSSGWCAFCDFTYVFVDGDSGEPGCEHPSPPLVGLAQEQVAALASEHDLNLASPVQKCPECNDPTDCWCYGRWCWPGKGGRMSIFTVIEQAKRRDDVVDAYAYEIEMTYGDDLLGEMSDWPIINQAIIDKWSLAGLRYIKEQAWRLLRRSPARGPEGER